MLNEPQQAKIPSNHPSPESESCQPAIYQIRVRSHLSTEWTDWFEGLTITLQDNGDMLLTGPVIDQAALYGLLKKVRDLGMPLIAVNPIQSDDTSLEEGSRK